MWGKRTTAWLLRGLLAASVVVAMTQCTVNARAQQSAPCAFGPAAIHVR